MSALTAAEVRTVRRRSQAALVLGQMLAGIGVGATFSAGTLLVTQVAGTPALGGLAGTLNTLGAATAAIPLAMLARRSGRSWSLTTGALIAAAGAVVGLVATASGSLVFLLVGLGMLGVGTAVNLQARFAATDLSDARTRGRDLALVVWATTIGAVAGPNLLGPGDAIGRSLGLPDLSGVFLFAVGAQLLAALCYLIGLRPDPLAIANRLAAAAAQQDTDAPTAGRGDRAGVVTGIIALAASYAVMVSVMSMTPVHLVDHGASLEIVGITISLHVAGMFGVSPLFGWLADRVGRRPVIALGQGMLLLAVVTTAAGAESQEWIVVGLTALGLGWSAATVAASALVAESADPLRRTTVQGRADLVMNLAGALGAALAGPGLAYLGYPGLSLAAGAFAVAVLVMLAPRAIRRPAPAG